MTDKIQLIKEEIARLQSEYKKESYFRTVRGDTAREVLDKLLYFIDSLPEEPKCIYNRTLEEREKFCKYCSAACDVRIEEELANKDLEEACDDYYDETWDEHGGIAMVVNNCHDIWFPSQATNDFFKAGAEWQKQQMKEILQTEYEKGRFDMREEMMKDAVEGEEIWKPIVGFEEYEVSNKGRVLSRKQKLDGVLLKQQTNLVGYKYVTLRDKKYNPHLALVHRLVAEAFIPNPFKKPTVNHIDEDKGNNIVSNLEWATYIEQKNHGSQKRPDVCPSMIDNEGRQSRRLISTRAYLRKCKYIIDDLNMIAYYDDNTHRSKKFEEEKRFYNYKPYNGEKFDRLPFITRPQKAIEVISDDGTITVYKNISQAANSLGVSISLIKRRLKGIGGTSGNFAKLVNYSFKYKD